VYDSFPVIFPGELIQQPDSVQVLFESRRLEFGISPAQVVAFKLGIAIHPPAEQSTADRAVCQYRYAVALAVRQDIFFYLALEKIVGRLRGMNRSDQAEFIHLRRRKVANANRANLALLEKSGHRVGGLVNRCQRIRPVHLVDIDLVGPEPLQRRLDFGEDARAGRVAKRLAVAPVEPDLGSDHYSPSQTA